MAGWPRIFCAVPTSSLIDRQVGWRHAEFRLAIAPFAGARADTLESIPVSPDTHSGNCR
jgi:hypothetical protein